MNSGREYLRKLKVIKKKKGDEPLTQEEIDILWSSMKDKEIERRPEIGCLIMFIGTIVFWSLFSYLLSSLLW
jgi:thymidine phosphorylase